MIIFVGIKEIYFFCHCSFLWKVMLCCVTSHASRGLVGIYFLGVYPDSAWTQKLLFIFPWIESQRSWVWESYLGHYNLPIISRIASLWKHFLFCLIQTDWLHGCCISWFLKKFTVGLFENYKRECEMASRLLPIALGIFNGKSNCGIVAQHLRKDKCNQ